MVRLMSTSVFHNIHPGHTHFSASYDGPFTGFPRESILVGYSADHVLRLDVAVDDDVHVFTEDHDGMCASCADGNCIQRIEIHNGNERLVLHDARSYLS